MRVFIGKGRREELLEGRHYIESLYERVHGKKP